jgi:tetrachlorobenzoquinone reductase
MIRFIHLRIGAVEAVAEGIVALTLQPLKEGMVLPPFEPGAHIELQVPLSPGVIRSRCYALINPPDQRQHYRVAVAAPGQAAGRPGPPESAAAWLVSPAAQGQVLRVSAPRAHWALQASSAPAVFMAEGIGLAALVGLVRQRVSQGLPWQLHAGVDDPGQAVASAPFGAELQALAEASGAGALHWFSAGEGLRLGEVIDALDPAAHLYVCGALPWLAEVRRCWGSRPAAHLHTESFDAEEAQRRGGFTVVLRQSGRELPVAPGQTILEAVLAAGIDAAYNCRSGHCGRCEVAVLAGVPDHRDRFLSDAQRQAGAQMLICCSGAKTPVLELDL